jgi:3-oxoacyl-(acyl-carrier-protein) synthase
VRSAVITGYGIVCPAGDTASDFAAAIRAGACPIVPLPDVRVPAGQRAVGARYDRDGRPEGRAHRMLAAAASQALDAAGLSGRERPDKTLRCATVTGTSLGDVDAWLALRRERPVPDAETAALLPRCRPEALARELAEAFELVGPRLTLSCACTSGVNGLGVALDWIRAGTVDRCLVAAVDTLNDFVLCGFSSLWALTQDAPRPFDRARTGMALGEAAAAVMVEAAETAGARGRACLAGFGASGDARHITAPDREGAGAARSLRAALGDAGWEPADVDYLNVHATGSLYNDTMIAAAVRAVFGERAGAVPVSSVNPTTGHTLGAAGLVEAVATLLAMEGSFVPPTPNLEAPEAEDLDLVREAPRIRSLRRTVSLTTGFGGANVAVALERRRDGGAR